MKSSLKTGIWQSLCNLFFLEYCIWSPYLNLSDEQVFEELKWIPNICLQNFNVDFSPTSTPVLTKLAVAMPILTLIPNMNFTYTL